MGEPAGATDMRRRSFVKLLGLAGVAAAALEMLIEPEQAVVEAAHAAGVPVSGDFWVTTQRQARRLGKILNIGFDRALIWSQHELGEMSINVDLLECDRDALYQTFMDRETVTSEIYLFDRKFVVDTSFIQSCEVVCRYDSVTHGVTIVASSPMKVEEINV